jgi:hypothetical protein
MNNKELIMKTFKSMKFEESVEQRRNCHACHGKGTVVRMVAKEPSQNMVKRWYVEYCTNAECGYWNCGFT